MRNFSAQFGFCTDARVHRVATLDSIAGEWSPDLRFLVLVTTADEKAKVGQLHASGLNNVGWVASATPLAIGDIVKPRVGQERCVVLYREDDVHHALLVTNQCNSYCLMCSQPPTKHEDGWLLAEAHEVIRHLRSSPASLGLSGGEPLLHAAGLRHLIDAIASQHPSTRIDVLTNGRLLSNETVVNSVLEGLQENVSWLVPLYGHADFVHDYVVQAHGAFDQTLQGILALQEHSQPIQLRIVLIEPVLRNLPELCGFIGRNLPFVREVALMATEPVGFALANRDLCEVDLLDFALELEQGAKVLNRHGVPFVLMNAPLCALPRILWPYAQKSISDWKNVYLAECSGCAVKPECSGLFAWHERGWKPTKIRAIQGEMV